MSDRWFYRIGDRITGPVTREEIEAHCQQGLLKPTDQVRMGDQGQWRKPSLSLFPFDVAMQRLEASKASEVVIEALGGPPVGIRGWLLLPVLWLVFSTGFTVIMFLALVGRLFVKSPTQEAASLPILVTLAVVVGAFATFGVVICACMSKRRKEFPTLMIVYYCADVVIGIAQAAFDPEANLLREVGMAIIGAAVWIPYFLVSKRVKATFTQ